MRYIISILFTFICFSAFSQSIRIPLHELEEAGDSGYHIRANALGDAEWYEITEYNGDTVIVWNPLTRKFGFIKKDSISTPLPDSIAYGTGTTNYLSRWIAPYTLGTAGISDDGSEIQFARPTVLYGVNTAAPATYGTFGIDNTLGIERPTFYNGSAWIPWLAYSGGTNQYSYFSNSNTITSGTQLTRDANGVSIGDGNYFKLPSNSTVGSMLGSTAGRMEFNTTAQNLSFRTSTATEYPVKSASSTGLGTSTHIMVYDANGKASGTSNLTWNGSLLRSSSTGTGGIIHNTASTAGEAYLAFQIAGITGAAAEFFGSSWAAVPLRNTLSFTNLSANGNISFITFVSGLPNVRVYTRNNGNTLITNVTNTPATVKVPSYALEVEGDAIGVPRGTTAQRPTIVASTAPIRFNSDSTAYEGGYGVGDWRLFADRTWVNTQIGAIPVYHVITRTIYDGDAALPDSTVAINGTFNAGFWRVPESMDGYTLTKASFGIFDKGDMIATGATYSMGITKCNDTNASCTNSSSVSFTPSSERELELTLSLTLNANDILRVNYQPPQGCGGGCGTENVNGLVVTYTIQEN